MPIKPLSSPSLLSLAAGTTASATREARRRGPTSHSQDTCRFSTTPAAQRNNCPIGIAPISGSGAPGRVQCYTKLAPRHLPRQSRRVMAEQRVLARARDTLSLPTRQSLSLAHSKRRASPPARAASRNGSPALQRRGRQAAPRPSSRGAR